MQKEWAKRWVRALISGGYPQTRQCLRDGKGYDPLGVLADISGLGYYSTVPFEEGEESKPRGFILYDTSQSAPPTVLGQLEELVGLRFESIGTIADLNDKGMPFRHIAGYIAKHYEAL
jgi:hypothetical protein